MTKYREMHDMAVRTKMFPTVELTIEMLVTVARRTTIALADGTIQMTGVVTTTE